MLAWFCPFVDAGSASSVPSPSSAPAASPTPPAPTTIAPTPQATIQPISAFMQVPKGWTLDRNVRVISPISLIRFQATKPYGGAIEAMNVSEDGAPATGTLETNAAAALKVLENFGSSFRLISSRSSFVCDGERAAWRLHYELSNATMHYDMVQYIAQAPHGAYDAVTYMRPGGSAADPEALAALGTFCPQDFVAPQAVPVITSMPGLRAPLPVGWTASASGMGMLPGSHVLASASKKLADGTMESYLVATVSLQTYGDVSGKRVSLATAAQTAGNIMLKMLPHSSLISSGKVLGCGGSDSQWQFEVRTPLSYVIERFAQGQGQLIVLVYGRPIKMVQPDPVAWRALDALCPSTPVASVQAP